MIYLQKVKDFYWALYGKQIPIEMWGRKGKVPTTASFQEGEQLPWRSGRGLAAFCKCHQN